MAGPVTVLRGFAYFDATYKKRKFRFADTHLEFYGDQQRLDQAKELVAKKVRQTPSGQ